jgi:hypothetical protein
VAIKLNVTPDLTFVEMFRISPDGSRVVFRARPGGRSRRALGSDRWVLDPGEAGRREKHPA